MREIPRNRLFLPQYMKNRHVFSTLFQHYSTSPSEGGQIINGLEPEGIIIDTE